MDCLRREEELAFARYLKNLINKQQEVLLQKDKLLSQKDAEIAQLKTELAEHVTN